MYRTWFSTPKEVQGKVDFEVCHLCFFLTYYIEKSVTITAEYYVVLLDKVKQQLVSKCWSKLTKWILFLQDNASPHSVAFMQQKLADLCFEICNTQPTHLIWLLQITTFFLNSKTTSKEQSFHDVTKATDKWFAAQPKEFFFFFTAWKSWYNSHKYVELRGEYVD